MATPNQAYVANSVPFGGLTVSIYRNQANPTLLGTYILESASPTPTGILNDRPDVDGGDNGWWLINGVTEGSFTAQLATDTTPTLENGDFFRAAIRRSSAGAEVNDVFVIASPSPAVGTTEYRKQSGTIRVDKTSTFGQ